MRTCWVSMRPAKVWSVLRSWGNPRGRLRIRTRRLRRSWAPAGAAPPGAKKFHAGPAADAGFRYRNGKRAGFAAFGGPAGCVRRRLRLSRLSSTPSGADNQGRLCVVVVSGAGQAQGEGGRDDQDGQAVSGGPRPPQEPPPQGSAVSQGRRPRPTKRLQPRQRETRRWRRRSGRLAPAPPRMICRASQCSRPTHGSSPPAGAFFAAIFSIFFITLIGLCVVAAIGPGAKSS